VTLKDYRLQPLSGQTKSVVLLLHGLGDSGSGGLLDIGRIWQQVLPETLFICPDAPFDFDMAPPDFDGRQWFSLREFSVQAIDEGAKTAEPILNAYIDGILAALSLRPEKLALVGFSQGTIMSLQTALRRTAPIAAIVGYSGMLANAAALPAEIKSKPPTLLVHGMLDEVLPFRAMGDAETALKTAGVAVRTLACPRLAHSIDEAGIAAGMQFLQNYL
jgi:phospholipase/carboxylesterase